MDNYAYCLRQKEVISLTNLNNGRLELSDANANFQQSTDFTCHSSAEANSLLKTEAQKQVVVDLSGIRSYTVSLIEHGNGFNDTALYSSSP